jgi:hypothetical protein
MYVRIMMDDGHAIRAEVYVELDRIRAEGQGAVEGGQGILGELTWRTTMTDSFHSWC